MLREGTLEDISDGKLYSENDMIKADTNSCRGCKSVCCHGMGKTIILDPYDIYRLTAQFKCSFDELLNGRIELNVVDGIILPNLKMDDTTKDCSFLDENRRCQIHMSRPGICRLFPLGRYWEDDEHFKYILQTGQCRKDNLTKIKLKKWLDTPDLAIYNSFITKWHVYIKKIQRAMQSLTQDQIRILTMYTLKTFYTTPYDINSDFYSQFDERMELALKTLALN